MAHVLATEILLMASEFGIENLGFLTLTFADHVTSIKEGQRRFNSLNTHVLKGRYRRAIGVVERQKSRRLHWHLVVALKADIRSGFDFEACERGDYRSANLVLRSEWAYWRKTAPKYRFGRTELLPIKSTAEGIGRYVGKYVSKHIKHRDEEDKGARIIRFIGFKPGERHTSSRFSWNSVGGWLWRRKVAAWCKAHGIADLGELRKRAGVRWAWRLKDEIMGMELDGVYPSFIHASVNQNWIGPRLIAELYARKFLGGREFVKTYVMKES